MRANAKEIEERIRELQTVILNPALRNKMEPLFYDYFKSSVTTGEGIRNYFLQSATISELLQTEGKHVLEIGCGFGLRLICLSLLGAHKASGVDISEEMIQGFSVITEKFPQLDIEAKEGDFLLADYPPGSFDVVLVIEAISHIRDTIALLDKIHLVLRPGGTLYISDGNNDTFFLTRIGSRRAWKTSEHGPIPKHMAEHGRKVDRLCFFEARMEIIKELLTLSSRHGQPSVTMETLKLIAKKTQGMYGEEITKAVEEFVTAGKISQKASFPYRNPYTGEFPELGFNPFRLAKDLGRRGFKCRFVPPPWVYVGVPLRVPRSMAIAARVAIPVLRKSPGSLLPFLSPQFCIVALKEPI